MNFETLIIDENNPSVCGAMGITQEEVLEYIKKLSIMFNTYKTKTKTLTALSHMTEREEKCFCFLSIVGYQTFISNNREPFGISNQNN